MWLGTITSSTILAGSRTSDPLVFPLLNEYLSGTHFSSDIDVIASVEVFLQGQDELFYKTGIQKLQKRWNKCIEVSRDYVEK